MKPVRSDEEVLIRNNILALFYSLPYSDYLLLSQSSAPLTQSFSKRRSYSKACCLENLTLDSKNLVLRELVAFWVAAFRVAAFQKLLVQ